MAENKTRATQDSVTAFVSKIKDQQLRNDCHSILNLMGTITGSKPVMWGSSIIGFGTIHYAYESGREGDMPALAFSPRKQNISIYAMVGQENAEKLLSRLGKHTSGKGCLYIKTLEDVNVTVLKQILNKAYKERMKKHSQ